MREVFEFARDNLLRGMPSGMLVTPAKVDFDIGHWQHKPYWDNDNIKHHLKQCWCSTVINIFIFHDTIRNDQILKFMDDSDFEIHGRNIFLIYLLCVPRSKVTVETDRIVGCKNMNINRFSQKVEHQGYVIYINDFVKNILKLNE